MVFFDFLFGKKQSEEQNVVQSATKQSSVGISPIEEIVIACIKDMKLRGQFSSLNLEAEAINLATFIFMRENKSIDFHLDFLPKGLIEKTSPNDYIESDKVFSFFVKHSAGQYDSQHADSGKKGYKLNINLDNTIDQTLRHHFHKIHNVVIPEKESKKFETVTPNGAVDLALPSGILWASMNIGASSEYDDGNYYAWGETEEKEIYGWETFKHANGSFNTMKKYCDKANYGRVDNKFTLDSEDDAAQVILGNKWHIPSSKNLQELIDHCQWKWECRNGRYGWKITGTNGNSIFLPASGAYSAYRLANVNESGRYWCSDMESTHSAFGLRFNSMSYEVKDDTKFYGRPIRPVFSNNHKNAKLQEKAQSTVETPKLDVSLNSICWLAIKQLAETMAQSDCYRTVDTSCRKLSNGSAIIHQCFFDGSLYNDWIFEGKDGWLNTATVYGKDLDEHQRIIGNSMEVFGMRVTNIIRKTDRVVFYLDRSIFGVS